MAKSNYERRRRRNFHTYLQRGKPMVSVVISNKNIAATLHDATGKALDGVSTVGKKLKSNIPSASEIGAALCKKIKARKIDAIVFNKSGFKYHGKVAMIAEQLREGGIKC